MDYLEGGGIGPVSDVGRYRRAYPRLFRHAGFKKLTPTGQRLAVYTLWGPQSNRLGLMYFSVNVAAEDLNVTAQSIRRALAELAVTFGWSFDAAARVLYIPSWWRWNAPDHEKVLRGNLKDLHDVPPCALVEAFATNIVYLKLELHTCFTEACHIAIGKASCSQDQSRSRKQEQDGRAARGSLSLQTQKTDDKDGREQKALVIAREVLQLTNPHGGMEYLIDSFRQFDRSFSESLMKSALNLALSERRQATA